MDDQSVFFRGLFIRRTSHRHATRTEKKREKMSDETEYENDNSNNNVFGLWLSSVAVVTHPRDSDADVCVRPVRSSQNEKTTTTTTKKKTKPKRNPNRALHTRTEKSRRFVTAFCSRFFSSRFFSRVSRVCVCCVGGGGGGGRLNESPKDKRDVERVLDLRLLSVWPSKNTAAAAVTVTEEKSESDENVLAQKERERDGRRNERRNAEMRGPIAFYGHEKPNRPERTNKEIRGFNRRKKDRKTTKNIPHTPKRNRWVPTPVLFF